MADFTADVARLESLQSELKNLAARAGNIASSVRNAAQGLRGIKSIANKGYPSMVTGVASAIDGVVESANTGASRMSKIADTYRSCEINVKNEITMLQRRTQAVEMLGVAASAAKTPFGWTTAEWHKQGDGAPLYKFAGATGLAASLCSSQDTPIQLATELEDALNDDRLKISAVANRSTAGEKLTWKQKLSRFLNSPKTLKTLDGFNNAMNSFLDGPVKRVSSFIGKLKLGGIQLPDIYALDQQARARAQTYYKRIDDMRSAGASKEDMYLYAAKTVVSEAYRIADDSGLIGLVKKYVSMK